MEYVGRRVKKEFVRQGIIFGSIEAYEPTNGLFRIVYDGGDSEELELAEVSKLLVSVESERETGGVPQKQRGIVDKGKISDNSVIESGGDGRMVDGGGDCGGIDLNLNEGPVLNDGEFIYLSGDDRVGNEGGGGAKLKNLDLNEGFNSELDEVLVLSKGVVEESLKFKKRVLDLNLDANEDMEISGDESESQWFDLNLGLTEVQVRDSDGFDGLFGANDSAFSEGDTLMRDGLVEVDNNVSLVNVDVVNVNLSLNVDNNEQNPLKNSAATGVDNEELAMASTQRKKRGRKRKDASSNTVELATPESTKMEFGTRNMELDLETTEETPLKTGSDSVDYNNGIPESSQRGRLGRKRIELSDNTITLPTPGTGLRRSSRRSKTTAFSGQDQVLNANPLSSPAVSAMSDEKMATASHGKSTKFDILPPKVELPPSSLDLDLKGVSPFDLVSVYAFLRSFSTLLFLSPFELGDFVASIKCNDSTLLFDSIHVSLLRALRKLLESLSREGSASASDCLRSLNWDFLDLITWPMFLVEYLLLHSPGYIPGLDLSQLKLFQCDYYKMPVSAKVQILKHLCDDVIETEAFKSEVNRRAGVSDRYTDLDGNIKFERSKRRKAVNDVASPSCITEDADVADGNSDECGLCKMDGILICCDGCPAAFHSRCVGVITSLLPEGDWFCPECSIEKNNKPWMKVDKSIRGSELLGGDPYGRQYYISCGYLLVLESCNDKYSFWSYNRNDLPTLVESLESSPLIYKTIISAIIQHWNLDPRVGETGNRGAKMENQLASSEGSTEVSQTFTKTDSLDVEKGQNCTINCREMMNYVNCYEFARTAYSVSEELTCKSLNKASGDASKSVEEIIAGQLMILNRFAEFSWSNIKNSNVDNSEKEKCGLCFCCRVPEEGRECLSIINDRIPAVQNFTCEILGIRSTENRKNHLVDIMCHIICIEDHLQGLLLGPWLNQNYSMIWRNSVLEVSELYLLKNLLLQLESNLHHLAFSADWGKHVDSVSTMGSACHIISSSSRRKRVKSSGHEITPSSNSATGLSLFWYRGGRASRGLFNWKVLPRSLASKAARQGGRKKIPGVLYPDSGEYVKRKKCVSWRASVEAARSVDQLALLVRELVANIRWDDIGNTNHISKMDKESIKSMRSFKKAIIRKKCTEGPAVRYLLDFGKRRYIPDVVVKHGSKFEDASSEKKKYWLEDTYVPLHLLKAFEEKKIARKSNKMKTGKLGESSTVVGSIEKKGFTYLFSRAERLENYQCEHCHKDVLIREAVSCQYCKGFFHKRHVKKSAGSITSECTYTCQKCQGGKLAEIDPKLKNASKRLKLSCTGKEKKRGKVKKQVNSKKKKRVTLVVEPLRRSARNAERVSKTSLKNTNVKKRKKAKQANSGKRKSRKLNNFSGHKKRTPVHHSYWLNGLKLSRMPNDEKVMHFRNRMLIVLSGQRVSANDEPKCSLCCEVQYKPELNYVACENCRVWFHGDALNLGADKIENLIGFKCYKCLNKRPPVCPHNFATGSNNVELV